MTIDEAIEIKTFTLGGTSIYTSQEEREAEVLGIEALKRLREMRLHEQWNPSEMLAGETE